MKRYLSTGSLVICLLLMGFVTHAAACCNCPQIDIKPGSFPNSINLRSQGVIAVAWLSDEGFDAIAIVNPATVTFGPNHAMPVHPGGHVEDVDFDGDMDLVFHFNKQETGIQPGDTEATSYATSYGGTPMEASDSIRTVPPH